MQRRGFLALAGSGVASLAGCSQVQQLTGTGTKSLGDTVTYDEDIEVTVTDAMTTSTVSLNGNEMNAPSNGIYALFRIEANNTDVTEREGPAVNPANYDTLENDDNTIYTHGVNDIRVYGDGEGGHFPDNRRAKHFAGMSMSVAGNELQPYPTTMTRPQIPADGEVSGWVVGVIKQDQTPQVRIQWKGTSAMWSVGDADLSTPTPQNETVVLG